MNLTATLIFSVWVPLEGSFMATEGAVGTNDGEYFAKQFLRSFVEVFSTAVSVVVTPDLTSFIKDRSFVTDLFIPSVGTFSMSDLTPRFDGGAVETFLTSVLTIELIEAVETRSGDFFSCPSETVDLSRTPS